MAQNGLVVYHNSQGLFYRAPFGAVPVGQRIRLRIQIQAASQPACQQMDTGMEVLLRLWSGYEGEKIIPMVRMEQSAEEKTAEDGSCIYQVEITPDRHQIFWYYFIINLKGMEGSAGSLYYYSRSDDRFGGTGCLGSQPFHSYQITVYRPEFHVPKWYREGVMYQIFPDRFRRTQISSPDSNKAENITQKNSLKNSCVQSNKEQSSICKSSFSGEITKKQIVYHENWGDIPKFEPDPETGKIQNNDFFGGTLQGILDKLDYLKELGISIIYLNPVFEAFSNHRYDTGDYKQIDPMLGDLCTFQRLCKKAESMGIQIILDGVFSHTGSDSVYFNKEGNYASVGAWQSKDSPYASWYRFRRFPVDYDCWWGVKTLPNVNEMEPSYLDFIARGQDSVARYWLKHGAAGWRLDVADELPDAFLKEIRKAVKETNPEAVVIGEVWEDASNKVSYDTLREYLLGEELDSVMNYPFRKLVLDFLLGYDKGENLYKGSMTLYENYPKEAFFATMNLLGTHDVTRLRTVLGEAPPEISLASAEQAVYRMTEEQKALASKRQRIAVVLQMTLPGVPSIYYGDEAGMEGYRDPFNRGTYPWGKEDHSMIQWYKKLIHLRNDTDALKKGHYIPVTYRDGVYGFIRIIENNRDVFGEYAENGFLLVLVNSSSELRDVSVDLTGRIPKNNLHGQEYGLGYELQRGHQSWLPKHALKDVLNEEKEYSEGKEYNEGKEYRVDEGKLSLTMEPFSSKILT